MKDLMADPAINSVATDYLKASLDLEEARARAYAASQEVKYLYRQWKTARQTLRWTIADCDQSPVGESADTTQEDRE